MRRLLTALLLAFASISAFAADNTSVYKFLTLPVSAQVSALGGSNVSHTSGDVSFALQNPSLLAFSPDGAIALSYVNYIDDVQYASLAYAQPIDSLSFIGAAFTYLGYGSFDGYDEYDVSQGSFSAADLDFAVIYARRLSSSITAGLSLKPVYSYIDNYNSFGLALDLGAVYSLPSHLFSLGAAVRNFGVQFTAYDHDRGRLPWDIQVGFTKGLAHAPFRFSVTYVKLNRWDLDYVKDASIYDADDNVDNTYSRHVGWGDMLFRHLLFGVEFLPSKNFSLTASYNHRRHAEFNMDNAGSFSGFAFGGQLHVYKFDLGVSYAIYGPSGGVFGLSIGTAISSFAH